MFNKIKKFLTKRGWYTKADWVRHGAGSFFLTLFCLGAIDIITGAYCWELAALVAFIVGLGKELYEANETGKFSFKDQILNTMGVLAAVFLMMVG